MYEINAIYLDYVSKNVLNVSNLRKYMAVCEYVFCINASARRN